MKAKKAAKQARIVVQEWSGEGHEVNAPVGFNQFYNRPEIKYADLKLAEGASFPAQLDVHDPQRGYTRYVIMRVYTSEPQLATYKSAASAVSELVVTK